MVRQVPESLEPERSEGDLPKDIGSGELFGGKEKEEEENSRLDLWSFDGKWVRVGEPNRKWKEKSRFEFHDFFGFR